MLKTTKFFINGPLLWHIEYFLLSPFPDVKTLSEPTFSFLAPGRLWNSLPIARIYFSDFYDLNGFKSRIPNLGVSMAILNTIARHFSCCKLNFGPLQGQIKSCHFPERTEKRGDNISTFYIVIHISWNNFSGWFSSLLDNDLDFLLHFKQNYISLRFG